MIITSLPATAPQLMVAQWLGGSAMHPRGMGACQALQGCRRASCIQRGPTLPGDVLASLLPQSWMILKVCSSGGAPKGGVCQPVRKQADTQPANGLTQYQRGPGSSICGFQVLAVTRTLLTINLGAPSPGDNLSPLISCDAETEDHLYIQ